MSTNILHVVTGFADGGLEKVVLMLVSGIRNPAINHFAVSLLRKENTFLEPEFIRQGVHPVYFDFNNRSLLKNISQLFRLASYIKKNNITVIHTHDFFPAFSARAAAVIAMLFYFHKVRRIYVTLHNQFFWLNKKHHFLNRVLSYMTTRIICVSASVKEYSVKHDRISESKYRIIYNGVDIQKYTPDENYREIYRKEFNTADSIVIGNVGVLSVRKGQIYLLKALNSLKKYNLKLLLFGSERPHEKDVAEEIYNYITENGLSAEVSIIPPRQDLNLIYNLFDIFVMPSVSEGLSLSAMEAMLMKRICLFSDIGPFREMVNDKENGFLFASKDSESLTQKLEYIIRHYPELKPIAENARKTALERYDINRMCREYESIYLN